MRLFLILLIFFSVSRSEEIVITERVEPKVVHHHFPQIYSHIRTTIEGNYVNHPKDKGGETYGGVSRRMHPEWFGWRYIDAAKPIKRHECVSAADRWVMDFYLTIWVQEGFENIDDYDLALNLFDFRIHSSPRTVQLKVNRVLKEMNECPIVVREGWISNQFNHIDTNEFILRLKIQRLILFNNLVARDPDQLDFYRGWISRLENI
jgi:lysozyme family protein